MTNPLPVPTVPHSIWPRFITAVYEHGKRNMAAHIYDEEVAQDMLATIMESLRGPSPDAPRYVRPSGSLCCEFQTHAMINGVEPEPMPDDIGLTFALGHFLHWVAGEYMKAALPPGFKLELEKCKKLDWGTHERLATEGHMDMVITVEDADLAMQYLDPAAGDSCLTDFKTMGGYSYRKHCTGDIDKAPDGFGYISQLSVYSEGGTNFDACVLAGINRDVVGAPIACREVVPGILKREAQQVRRRIAGGLDGVEPKPEMRERWGKEADFYCGGGARKKKGYCPYRFHCPGGMVE